MQKTPAILIVDDQPDNLLTLRGVIETFLGDSVILEADSGFKCLEVAAESFPDVIILDIVMPGMDGYETCRKLKEDEQLGHIPVMLLTALKTDTTDKVKGLESGADAFLPKPIDPAELTAQLKVLLRTKWAEDQLRQDKRKLNKLVDKRTEQLNDARQMSDTFMTFAPICYQSLNENGEILEVNGEWEKVLGYTKQEVSGKPVSMIVAPDWHGKLREAFDRFSETNETHVILKLTTKNKKEFFAEVHGRIKRGKDGKSFRTHCVFFDISEKLRAENKLRESEEKYRNLVELAPYGICIIINQKFAFVNPASADIFGGTAEEITGRKIDDFIHPDEKERVLKFYKSRMEGGDVPKSYETKLLTSKGKPLYAELTATIIDFNGQKADLVLIHDITARKKAENELKLLSTVVEQSPSAIVITNRDIDIEYVNPQFTRQTGYEQNEVIGKNPRILKSGYHDEKFYSGLYQTILSGSQFRGRMYNRRKDGSLYWEDASIAPVKDGSGNITGFVKIAEDITQMVEAEEALIESERRMTTLVNNLQGIAYRCRFDKDYTMEFISSGFTRITGFDTGDVIQNRVLTFNDLIHPDDREQVWDKVENAVVNHRQFELRYRLRTIRGEYRHVAERGIAIYNDQTGEVEALEGFIYDITSLVKANEILRQNEEMMRSVTESAGDAIITLSHKGNILTWNRAATNIFGRSSKEMIGSVIEDIIPDKKLIKNLRELKRSSRKSKHSLTRLFEVTAKGEKNRDIPIEVSISTWTLDGPPYFTLIIRDISERRKAELFKEILSNISKAAISNISLGEFVKAVQSEIGRLIDTRNFFVALYNRETDMLSFPHYDDEADSFEAVPAEKTLTKYVIDTGKPLMAGPEVKEELVRQGKIKLVGSLSRVWVGIPLKIENEVFGVYAVQNYQDENAYTAEDMRTLEIIADQIGLAIYRKKTEEELAAYRKNLEVMVKERTAELEQKNAELQRFNKLFVGREFRIKELRDERKALMSRIKELEELLKKSSGRPF